ncbi:efflux RND transporter permease subunit [Pseudoalteromonas fenneropenaei]|uniref:Efflux RND transporter permease subunit n=1 Tax=Pseudoalteromonas fenneropenaei TaxID=1737459 RepID=A0ABV7CH74_9GAMM
MIAWFARNHVAANLLMLSLLFVGLMSLVRDIPLEVFPDTASDRISVAVSLRGATPEDVERGVTIRIEEAVADLEGIERITSRSTEGSANITIETQSGYDPRELLADVKSRVDAISTLPIDAERPRIALAQRNREVINLALSGPLQERELRTLAEQLRDDLLREGGITQVSLEGVRNYEIAINVSQDALRQYNLTLGQISSLISNSSQDISAGNVKTEGGEILLRSKGQAYQKQDFAKIIIKTAADGSLIRLGDIAQIADNFEETPLLTRFNGEPAALIQVYRVGAQSAITVADIAKAFVQKEQARLPQGVNLTYWDDDSEVVKKRLSTLTSNAIQGGILVLALLTLFLRPAIAFWVFIGIPISFTGAFLAMAFFDISLNLVSLFGFILVLGIVVDDAIVTGENVYRHLQNGRSGLDAAIKGTQEVATPVTFGVLTTVVAFIPMLMIEGGRGAMFAQIAVVVIPVLLFSLVESKFVLPAHLKYLKQRKDEPLSGFSRWQQNFANAFEAAILKYYQPVLRWCLNNKTSTLLGFGGIFVVILVMIMSGWLRFVFFPRIESETARVNLTMPTGTPFEVTDGHIERMVAAALQLKEKYTDPVTGQSVILNVLSSSGSSGASNGSAMGRVRFEIQSPEVRVMEVSSVQLVNEWRALIGPVAGAEVLTFRAEFGRLSDPIDVQLSGNNLDELSTVAEFIKEKLNHYEGVFDIADSLSDGKQEIQIDLNDVGLALGLNRAEVLRQVRNAFYGAQVQRIQRGRDDIRVMVRLPAEERISLAQLGAFEISVPGGKHVPLGQVATFKAGQSPASIYRIDRYRTLNVTADIDKESVNMTALQADLQQFLSDLTAQYPGVSYSLEGEAKEQRQSFGSLEIGLLFTLFAIYALLAIPFKSYGQPLVVMSVIPFGAIGAIAGHLIMGMDLTMMSLLGILALIGVVVNDSLVLVDFINNARKQGTKMHDALLQAGVVRFRPVMLTSLTTFIGLMPLLFERSTQAQFLIPMAVSLGFGILFATFITLILVPINYQVMATGKALILGKPKPQ